MRRGDDRGHAATEGVADEHQGATNFFEHRHQEGGVVTGATGQGGRGRRAKTGQVEGEGTNAARGEFVAHGREVGGGATPAVEVDHPHRLGAGGFGKDRSVPQGLQHGSKATNHGAQLGGVTPDR